ncbi:hypothetical protein FJZ40_01515, partial [Candidatus Shapirobacteria bacterium]|nr:hypothetical protein [Candidatus Shapirobacteria bacterium]
DDLGTPGKDNYFGYGRINACRALGGTNCGTNPTRTPTPTATPGLTSTPTPTVTPGGPTATPSPTATPIPGQIKSLTFEVMLQGINSQKRDKNYTIIIKGQGKEVTRSIYFSSNKLGIYAGKIDLAGENLTNGAFDISAKTPYFLRKKFSSITLSAGDNTITKVGEPDLLKAGDIDNSGVVNALDVSLIKNGYSPFNQTADAADLNLDGYINSLDYSLVLSNYGRRDDEGPLPTPTPTLTPIPSITPRPTSTPSPTTTPKPTATPTPMPTSTPKPTATPTPGLSSGIILFNSSQQTLKEYLTNLSKRRGWYLLSVNTSDPREVKKEILKLTTSNNAIRYLLIIGSEKTIPLLDTTGLIMPYIPGPGSSTSNAVLDNFYYGDIDDDLLVDLAVGRIPTEDLNKIKAYFSQAPPRGTSDIFASHMINQISFRESVCLQENLGMKVTLNGTKEDLLGALDTSSVFGIETHGGPDWWNLKDGTFSSQDIPNLTNHPVVISASCETSAILGKNFLWKGASAYLGYWFINAGFEPTVPIYRKLRLGFPLGEAIKESINRNFADFVVRNHDNFVGADYPSFQTLSITSEKEKLRNSSGRASFAAGILLYGDPSLSIGKTLTEPNILAEKASEITLILPANKYLLGNSDPTGTPVTFCSTNKSDLNQAWLSYLPSENSEGNIFAELPPLVFPLDSGWTSISSGTWKINNQTPFTIPNKVSNYFASLIRGRSQNFLVLHDKLFLKGGLGKEHSIIINASR